MEGVRSQELNPNSKAQPLAPLLLLAHDQRQGEVDLEACDGVGVHEPHASSGAGQLLLEVAQGLLEGLAGVALFASKGTSTGITMFLLRSHSFLHQIELNRDREVRSNIVGGAFHAALAILT